MTHPKNQNPKQRSKAQSAHELGSGQSDRCLNDPFEVFALVVATLGVIGGCSTLWYLFTQVPH